MTVFCFMHAGSRCMHTSRLVVTLLYFNYESAGIYQNHDLIMRWCTTTLSSETHDLHLQHAAHKGCSSSQRILCNDLVSTEKLKHNVATPG